MSRTRRTATTHAGDTTRRRCSCKASRADSREASIVTFRAILQGVHQPQSTTYSNIFDLATVTAYVYRDHNFRDVRVVDLREILAEGPPAGMTLDAYFEATGPE